MAITSHEQVGSLVKSTRYFRLEARGLVVLGAPTFDQWAAYGRVLTAISESVLWALGDWWLYGDHAYGESAGQAAPTGYALQTCQDSAWVASRFQSSRRRELPWTYHKEVAALPPAEADTWLDWVEAERAAGRTCGRADLRAKVREQHYLARTVERDWPTGQYGLIYADPPWQPDAGVLDPTRQIENQYPTLARADLVALAPRVAALAASDCVLLMWVATQKIEDYVAILAAWGFAHKTGAVWVKDTIGMGWWFRQRHELLMLATRGSPATPREAARPDSVITAPRRAHSQKPHEVYGLLEAMFPGVPKVELFARQSVEGWASWGNDAALAEAV